MHWKIFFPPLSDDLPRKRPPHIYKPPTAEMLAYLDFSVSTTGMLTGVKVNYSLKLLYTNDNVYQLFPEYESVFLYIVIMV